MREPFAPAHHLVLHHRDMSSGAAKGGDAEAQEESREFAERVRRRLGIGFLELH